MIYVRVNFASEYRQWATQETDSKSRRVSTSSGRTTGWTPTDSRTVSRFNSSVGGRCGKHYWKVEVGFFSDDRRLSTHLIIIIQRQLVRRRNIWHTFRPTRWCQLWALELSVSICVFHLWCSYYVSTCVWHVVLINWWWWWWLVYHEASPI